MQVRVAHISTRRSGAQARREQILEVESLSVGRATDNELVLNELTISLQHAVFRGRSDGVYAEALAGTEILVNGRVVTGDRVEPGDSVRIGPFELRVLQPSGQEQLSLEVEEVVRRADERSELALRTRKGVETGALNRRRLSIGLVVVLVFGFLVVPLFGYFQQPWSSGGISRNHSSIANECGACHKPFRRVSDTDCIVCHPRIGNHAAAERTPDELSEARCAECHVEHLGSGNLAILDQPLCEGCHEDLDQLVSETQLGNASDFHDDHPEFKLALVTDPDLDEPDMVEWSRELREFSGLSFSHLAHAGQIVPQPGGVRENLRCDACHVLDADGPYMLPIRYEDHCQDCHSLSFDKALPDTLARHGDPVEMREQLRGIYSQRALLGRVKDESAPRVTRFKRPGSKPFAPDERQAVYAWVEKKVAAAEKHLTKDPGECQVCHALLPGAARDSGFDVASVKIQKIWAPQSEFTHDAHDSIQCQQCHLAAAALDTESVSPDRLPSWSERGSVPYGLTPIDLLPGGAGPSKSAEDVLIPGIETCRECHGGAKASPPDVPSPCASCHPFHRKEHGRMHSGPEAASGGSDF